MKRKWIAVLTVLMAAPFAAAQPAGPGGAGQAAMQTARESRMQEMNARMMRLQSQLQQLNQRLTAMKMHQGFKDLGNGMASVCDRLQEMERHRLQLGGDPAVSGDRERVRAMERLQDRLRVMNREMEEAHDGLQGLVTMPARPGAPPDAAERMRRTERQKEMEQVRARVNERLGAMEAWSKGEKIPPAAKELTKDLLQIRDRLHEMNQSCDQISKDPAMEADRDRLRELDRINSRLHVMLREVEEASDAVVTTL